jgi:hypothetical protein
MNDQEKAEGLAKCQHYWDDALPEEERMTGILKALQEARAEGEKKFEEVCYLLGLPGDTEETIIYDKILWLREQNRKV